MKISKVSNRIILNLFAALTLSLLIPQTVFSQTEKLGIVSYTPPKGWTKEAQPKKTNTTQRNLVQYSHVNNTTDTFCVVMLYDAANGTGNPDKDFVSEWNTLVVPHKAAANPPRIPVLSVEDWTMISGGSEIEVEGRIAKILLNVFSGYGVTVSVVTVSDDKSYKPQVEAFIKSFVLDKPTAPPAKSNGSNIQSNSATDKLGSITFTSAQSPEAVIKAFYNGYIRSTGKGLDPFGKTSTLKKHLTARLIKKQITAHEASMDADYFLQSQEYHAEWENNFNISEPVIKGATATAFVTFPDDYPRVKVTLRKAAGVWKIDDVQNAKL